MRYLNYLVSGIAVSLTAYLLIINSPGQSAISDATTLNSQLTETKKQPLVSEPQPKSNSPRRLTITVSVSEPSDLKIQEESEINKGQIIADRSRERTRLTLQKEQLKLSLNQLKSQQITAPLPPAKVPPAAALPPISYLEQEANIEKSKVVISFIDSQISLKKQEIEYLITLTDIDPNILEHENNKLAQLKQNKEAAFKDYQLAMGKLQTAKDSRAYQEYLDSLNQEKRFQELNQANLNYQRQLAEYEQRLADKDYKITQFKLNLNNVENALASLATVKAPYSGKVRKINWLGQSPDGSLNAEITLMVKNE